MPQDSLNMKPIDESSSTSSHTTVVGLGELIWDLLPGGKQLGGAPNNFAYISHLLGNRSIVASRIGNDQLGNEALCRLTRTGIVTDYLQVDEEHPTGTVGVRVDDRGEAHFSMNEDSAWDYLEWNSNWEELARSADVVGFGTMAQRQPGSRETILTFLENTRPEAVRIFDVNLRHAFFTPAMLSRSLELANIVKLNDDELARIAGMLGLESLRGEAFARAVIDKFNVHLVAITRAENGSELITLDRTINHNGINVNVKDTIGAGDAFAAALAHFYVRKAPLQVISEAANRLGSWVATETGATPECDRQRLEQILEGVLSSEF